MGDGASVTGCDEGYGLWMCCHGVVKGVTRTKNGRWCREGGALRSGKETDGGLARPSFTRYKPLPRAIHQSRTRATPLALSMQRCQSDAPAAVHDHDLLASYLFLVKSSIFSKKKQCHHILVDSNTHEPARKSITHGQLVFPTGLGLSKRIQAAQSLKHSMMDVYFGRLYTGTGDDYYFLCPLVSVCTAFDPLRFI